MKFEPIKTFPNACQLFVEEAYEQLVSKLGVKAWHWYVPRTGSELERFLIRGTSHSRRDDFHDLRAEHPSYNFLDLFDHSICFKGDIGAPFVLVMPYGDNITFHKAFEGFKADYYDDKARVVYAADHLGSKVYKLSGIGHKWGQLHCMGKFDATIVPNWFKVRENGDFAAIIAMDNWLHFLSELGGFPLVRADGSER